VVDEDDSHTKDLLRARLEILEAMATVTSRRAELMAVVGSAADGDAALLKIRDHFGLNEMQAVAVLDLQVRRFAELERRRIADEAEEIRRRLSEV
jgi:DNA gyrase subunit A